MKTVPPISRRQFLVDSTATATGAALVANLPFVIALADVFPDPLERCPQQLAKLNMIAVEYEYPGGVRVFSQCRQINGCDNRVNEALVGTQGVSDCHTVIQPRQGENGRFKAKEANPYQQEHADLIAGIRAGRPLNEARQVAESTLTGIMGRDSAY
ncbi:MAG: twin-arginine translocation signal domain-containing protein [Verrucomicrobia bacterium]|nr:twin-arginine translocation signal domain-containing protein [Verrucomicrobiota bacterium]